MEPLGLIVFVAIGLLAWWADSGRMSDRAQQRDAERRRIIRDIEREWGWPPGFHDQLGRKGRKR